MAETDTKLGYLKTCIDRRYVEVTRKKLEEKTGLTGDRYWHEAVPGGAAVDGDSTGEDYAVAHGATILAWQAHLDKCGGQPGADNETITHRLDNNIREKKEKFPNQQHFRILASEAGIEISEV